MRENYESQLEYLCSVLLTISILELARVITYCMKWRLIDSKEYMQWYMRCHLDVCYLCMLYILYILSTYAYIKQCVVCWPLSKICNMIII